MTYCAEPLTIPRADEEAEESEEKQNSPAVRAGLSVER